MARSIIKNQVGEFKQTINVPASPTNAASFADAVLDGFYEVYSEGATSGSDAVTDAAEVNAMVKNTAGVKTYVSFLADSSKTTAEILTGLKGLTINGVHVDEAVILSFKPVTFA